MVPIFVELLIHEPNKPVRHTKLIKKIDLANVVKPIWKWKSKELSKVIPKVNELYNLSINSWMRVNFWGH